MIRTTLVRALFLFVAATTLATSAATADGPFQFFSVTPCRIADTRGNGFTGESGPPALASGLIRSFPIRGLCGVPTTAKAVAVNVTAVSPTMEGFLKIWPYNTTMPGVSTINFAANEPAIANGAIVPLATDTNLQVSIVYGTASPGGAVHIILDVTGFFASVP